MIIKKFQGRTEAEAAEAAKKELGSNMVIMNVRNVKRKGLFSFLLPQMVEVTVALEEEPDRVMTAVRMEERQISPASEQARSGTLTEGIKKLADGGTPAGAGSKQSDFFDSGDKQADSSAIEEKLDSLQTLL